MTDLFRPHLGEPHHHAYLVEEIETTVNRLVDQFGAGPFFLIEDVAMENVLSRGEPAEFAHNSAFGRYGTGVIELIETVSLAPERVGRGFSGPRPRIHHVAYAVPPNQVSQLRSTLNERGLPDYLSAQLGEVDVTFHDASSTLGHDLEIHIDNQQLRDSFGMVSDAAEGWDGSEPLRLLEG